MELSRDPAAFSDLVGRPVRDQAGRGLGRVFEARAHWERDGSVVLDAKGHATVADAAVDADNGVRRLA